VRRPEGIDSEWDTPASDVGETKCYIVKHRNCIGH